MQVAVASLSYIFMKQGHYNINHTKRTHTCSTYSAFAIHNMMQAQGRRSKGYNHLIVTVDIQSYSLTKVSLRLTILEEKKRLLGIYLNDKIMAAYSNIVIS